MAYNAFVTAFTTNMNKNQHCFIQKGAKQEINEKNSVGINSVEYEHLQANADNNSNGNEQISVDSSATVIPMLENENSTCLTNSEEVYSLRIHLVDLVYEQKNGHWQNLGTIPRSVKISSREPYFNVVSCGDEPITLKLKEKRSTCSHFGSCVTSGNNDYSIAIEENLILHRNTNQNSFV